MNGENIHRNSLDYSMWGGVAGLRMGKHRTERRLACWGMVYSWGSNDLVGICVRLLGTYMGLYFSPSMVSVSIGDRGIYC